MNVIYLGAISHVDFKQIKLKYDEKYGVLHLELKPPTRSCFNVALLTEIKALLEHLSITRGSIVVAGRVRRINYLVLCSGSKEHFSLGGDLSRIGYAARKKNRAWLEAYAELCIYNLWMLYSPDFPVTTIALVQGSALGGGFECALSCDVMIAERKSRFGFPESIFNLFPGMGALSFLSRRIGLKGAHDVIDNGQIFMAEEMALLGVVDVLAEDGSGSTSLDSWIEKTNPTLPSYQAVQRARKIVSKLDKKELDDVARVWVETALNMSEKSLKNMETIIRAQTNKIKPKLVVSD